MGARSREKGRRREVELAHLLGGARVSRTGEADGGVDVAALGLTWQCKARADGFKELYRWLEHADALALRADRQGWLVVMRLDTLLRLVGDGAPPEEAA